MKIRRHTSSNRIPKFIILVPPHMLNFNICLQQGTFPIIWNMSDIYYYYSSEVRCIIGPIVLPQINPHLGQVQSVPQSIDLSSLAAILDAPNLQSRTSLDSVV